MLLIISIFLESLSFTMSLNCYIIQKHHFLLLCTEMSASDDLTWNLSIAICMCISFFCKAFIEAGDCDNDTNTRISKPTKLLQCWNPYRDPLDLTSRRRSGSSTTFSASSCMDQNAGRHLWHQEKRPNDFDVSTRSTDQTSSRSSSGWQSQMEVLWGRLKHQTAPWVAADRVRWRSRGVSSRIKRHLE